MKILIIGFLALFTWSAISTHFYVCRIKGLCNEKVSTLNSVISSDTVRTADSLPAAIEQPSIPENLVIYFAFDKSEFNPETISEKYVNESNKYLGLNQQAKLSITGHTDAVGSDEYNQALGFRRAQSVQRYFESKGITANKIIIESKGEKDPADNNGTASGRAINRRTAITIKN